MEHYAQAPKSPVFPPNLQYPRGTFAGTIDNEAQEPAGERLKGRWAKRLRRRPGEFHVSDKRPYVNLQTLQTSNLANASYYVRLTCVNPSPISRVFGPERGRKRTLGEKRFRVPFWRVWRVPGAAGRGRPHPAFAGGVGTMVPFHIPRIVRNADPWSRRPEINMDGKRVNQDLELTRPPGPHIMGRIHGLAKTVGTNQSRP